MSRRFIAAAILSGLVWACASQIASSPESRQQAPADFPEAYYREAAAQGRPVFRIDPANSLIVIEAHRGGSLAHLGHDHVIASHELRGYVAPESGRADLYVQLSELVVDEPELRAEAKFETRPSAADIAGTRQNMLRSLAAEQYPFVFVSIRGDGPTRLNVAISLHGVTRTSAVPAQVESSPAEFTASGRLSLNQTDFGIKPFSILGGAVQVQDRVDLRFAIRALPIGPP